MPALVLTNDPACEKSELLLFLIANLGKTVSMQQMMEALGLRSPAPVLFRLQHMEERGQIRRLT